MCLKLENEEFLPKWLTQTYKPKTKGDTVIKIVLVLALWIFSLGLMSMFDYATNGMKGKH